jgi:hypothetical protein
VFWTIPISRRDVDVNLAAGRAAFRLSTQIFDDHDLQSSITEVFPAHNEAMNFEGRFLQTGSTMNWSAFNPASGFEFRSEDPNPARLIYAVIGHERNGVFFT